jgi:hypothetical protein
LRKYLVVSKKVRTFAPAYKKQQSKAKEKGRLAQLV